MILLELDNFDDWALVAGEKGIGAFSPLFVYLIHWAAENNKLDESFIKEAAFSDGYSKLLSGELSFTNFALDILDGKLADSYFAPEIRKFMHDYIDYDGYIDDLSNYFKLNMWELPCDLEQSRALFEIIDKSYENYEKNQKSNPDIISFD